MLAKIGLIATGITLIGLTAWKSYKRRNYFKLPSTCRVHLVNDADVCETLITSLWPPGTTPILGLDAEWRPVREKGTSRTVALLQLSDRNNCVLIQLQQLSHMPPALIALLGDANVLKVGVAVLADARKLLRDYELDVRGCVDLQSVAYKYSLTNEGSSLTSLARTILKVELDKSSQCSNWERTTLSNQQVAYAALDAWIAQELFQTIYTRYGTEENMSEFVSSYIDIMPCNKDNSIQSSNSKPSRVYISRTRSAPLYDNYAMLAPDGQQLAMLSRRKANWYIRKGLAEVVTQDPPTIKLKFNPSGNTQTGSKKENHCVSCGKDKDYVRHYVVPNCYRKLFEERYKSHKSDDIVLLCLPCKDKINRVDLPFRNSIAEEYKVPLNGQYEEFIIDLYVKNAQLAASLLLCDINGTSVKKLPVEKRAESMNVLRSYLGKQDITVDDIQQVSMIEFKQKNPVYKSHAEMLVERLKTREDVNKFCNQWRSHFISVLQPKYLPPHWAEDFGTN